MIRCKRKQDELKQSNGNYCNIIKSENKNVKEDLVNPDKLQVRKAKKENIEN